MKQEEEVTDLSLNLQQTGIPQVRQSSAPYLSDPLHTHMLFYVFYGDMLPRVALWELKSKCKTKTFPKVLSNT